jgi:hypothetical protein
MAKTIEKRFSARFFLPFIVSHLYFHLHAGRLSRQSSGLAQQSVQWRRFSGFFRTLLKGRYLSVSIYFTEYSNFCNKRIIAGETGSAGKTGYEPECMKKGAWIFIPGQRPDQPVGVGRDRP